MRANSLAAAVASGALLLLCDLPLPAVCVQPTLNVGLLEWVTSFDADGVTRAASELEFYKTFYVASILAAQHFNERRSEFSPALGSLSCAKNISFVRMCDSMALKRTAGQQASDMMGDGVHAVLGMVSTVDGDAAAQVTQVSDRALTVSYWASSTGFSNKQDYPLFARTFMNDHDAAVIVSALCAEFGFRKVGLVFITSDSGSSFRELLFTMLARQSISMQVTGVVAYDAVSVRAGMQIMANLKLNVVIIVDYSYNLYAYANAAAEFGMLTDETFFIFPYLDRYPTASDTAQYPNLVGFLDGSVRIDGDLKNASNPQFEAFVRGYSTNAFAKYLPYLNSKLLPNNASSGSDSAVDCRQDNFSIQLDADFFTTHEAFLHELPGVWTSAYDAVMALGLAMCANDDDSTIPPSDALYANLLAQSFQGLSGHVAFMPNGDRDPSTLGFGLYFFEKSSASSSGLSWSRLGEIGFTDDALAFTLNAKQIPFKMGLGVLPVDVTRPAQDFNYIGPGLIGLGLFLFCSMQVLICFFMGRLARNRRERHIVNSQPELLLIILLGGSLTNMSILALASDDSPYSVLPIEAACMLAPALFSLGFQIALVATMAKMFRILTIFNNPSLQRHRYVKVGHAVTGVAFVTAIELSILIAWIVTAPLAWTRETVAVDANDFVLSSIGYCSTSGPTSVAFLAAEAAIHCCLLMLTAWFANKIKHVSADYQETRYLALALLCIAQIFFLAIPVIVSVLKQSTSRYVVCVLTVWFSLLCFLVFIFAPKVYFGLYGVELLPISSTKSERRAVRDSARLSPAAAKQRQQADQPERVIVHRAPPSPPDGSDKTSGEVVAHGTNAPVTTGYEQYAIAVTASGQ